MKAIKLYMAVVASLLLTACDNIPENERLIYEMPVTAQRTVLIEDFTGQLCSNCPNATEVIEGLQEEYGDAIVAVGIHSGPLGFKGNSSNIGLATDVGDEYYNYWQIEHQPMGLVNRRGAKEPLEWTAAVKEELAKPATVALEGYAQLVDDNISVQLDMTSIEGPIVGKLQVWILEDSITAVQRKLDSVTQQELTIRDYVHNHVLRTTLNGTWGTDVSISEGDRQTFSYQIAKDAVWNSDQLSIVAFVHNDDGVLQAFKMKVNY